MQSTIYLSDGSTVIVSEDMTTLMNAFNGAKMVTVTLADGSDAKLVVNGENVVKIEAYAG